MALAGFIASLTIPAASAPVPGLEVNLNPFSETWRNIGFARHNRTVFLSILGISWFWVYGALFLRLIPCLCQKRSWGQRKHCNPIASDFQGEDRFGINAV